MIVEPTPTTPRSPWRRALRAGGLVLPVVLLAGAVGVGLLGPKVEPPAAATPRPAASSGTAAAASPGAPAPSPAGSPGPSPTAAAFPADFADLRAETPAQVRTDRAGGGDRGALLVAGILDVAPGPGCDDLPGGPLGPWCTRTGTIYEADPPAEPAPGAASGAPAGDGAAPSVGGPAFRPHLHVVVPAGVRLPDAVVAAAETGAASARVLVIGRFATVGCAGRCDDGFVVERVAWADGVRSALAPLLDDRLAPGGKRPNPFTMALHDGDTPLLAVLVWPDGVRDLDPAAARFALAGPASDPVWYVRALDAAAAPGAPRQVRWMLLAEKDLHRIASGRPVLDATATTP